MDWLIETFRALMTHPSHDEMSALERRSSWRLARKIGFFAIPRGGININVTSVDLGPGGICLQSPQAFRKGEKLTLRFPGAKDKGGAEIRVVWCVKRKGAPGFRVGVVFAGPDASQERAIRFLEACGVPSIHPREKRRAPRVNVQMSGMLSTQDGTMYHGTVVDLSVGGCMIQTTKEIDVETKITFQVVLGKNVPMFETSGVVVRVRHAAQHGFYNLGIHFTGVSPSMRKYLMIFLSAT